VRSIREECLDRAALGYAWTYGKSIWQAMVLGLLLGAGVQALMPRDWLVRLFGSMKFAASHWLGLFRRLE
jgi:uncharacterized membrane protein YraQ (UPF0718 family)